MKNNIYTEFHDDPIIWKKLAFGGGGRKGGSKKKFTEKRDPFNIETIPKKFFHISLILFAKSSFVPFCRLWAHRA